MQTQLQIFEFQTQKKSQSNANLNSNILSSKSIARVLAIMTLTCLMYDRRYERTMSVGRGVGTNCNSRYLPLDVKEEPRCSAALGGG